MKQKLQVSIELYMDLLAIRTEVESKILGLGI